jgi:Fe-S-cluster-containing dehydrogenase component
LRLEVVDIERCVGCQLCMFACSRRWGEEGGGLSNSSIGVTSVGGMERGFKVIVCRACDDPPCARACPTGALEPREEGGGVTFDNSKCTGCGQCVDACVIGAVFWNEEENKPMICKYCGYCADFCPHGVLEFKEEK